MMCGALGLGRRAPGDAEGTAIAVKGDQKDNRPAGRRLSQQANGVRRERLWCTRLLLHFPFQAGLGVR
jgi:hypothetical protein